MRRLVSLSILLVAGCGADGRSSRDSLLMCPSTSALSAPPRLDIHTLAIPITPAPRIQAAPAGPTVIFLNRVQTTMKGGSDDSSQDISSVVQQQGMSQAMLPAFAGTDASWQQLVSCVRDEYKRFNVVVTDQRPTQPGYVQLHCGGNGSELGFPSGTGGVAPIDTQQCNVISDAVAYVFTDIYKGDVQGMCEAGAQELAHTFSLDHEYLCQDPMTYLQGCGAKTFQDVDAMCGESAARACSCGHATQNSVKILTQKLGLAAPDTIAPTVIVTSPTAGASVDGTMNWNVVASAADNVGVTKVELHVNDGTGDRASVCGDNSLPCTTSTGVSTWKLPPGAGMRTLSAWAYDAAGNVGKSTAVVVTLTQPGGGGSGGAGGGGSGGTGGGSDGGVGGTGGNGGNGGVGGTTTTTSGPFTITVSGLKAVYAPGERVSLQIQIVSSAGTVNQAALGWTDINGDQQSTPLCGGGGHNYSVAVQLDTDVGNRSFSVSATDDHNNHAATPSQGVAVQKM